MARCLINGEYVDIPQTTPLEEYKPTPQERIVELKAKLTQTDYLSHKHSDKALTDEEYEPMRLQRQQWRDEINELEKQL